jgi:hypothetical protein
MTITREIEAEDWWADRRLRYNVALLVAGVVAFFCYAGALDIRCRNVPEVEITLFTTLFQGIGYLIAVAIANVFYNLGYWSERILKPHNPGRYRRTVYALGFSVSVALPFSIPAMILLFGCAGDPSRQSSNQAMDRTATGCAFTFCVTSVSPLRATLALGGRRSSFSR